MAAALARLLVARFGHLADRKLAEGFTVSARLAEWAGSQPRRVREWLGHQPLSADRRARIAALLDRCLDNNPGVGYPERAERRMGSSVISGASSTLARPGYGWAVLGYDRLYRLLHGLDTVTSEVGPVLRLELTRSRRSRRLPDGTLVSRGDAVGVLHLNNARLAVLRAREPSVLAAGLEFRRQFVASLEALAGLAAADGPLAGVRAFAATTILHSPLRRLGFEVEPDRVVWPRLVAVYQRALLASLHPGARLGRPTYRRARRLWLSRDALVARFSGREVPTPGRRSSSPPAA